MTMTTQAPTLTGTWQLDPVHSNIEFRVNHLGLSKLRGRIDEFDAQLTSSAEAFKLEGSAQVDSIKMRDTSLIQHLMGPDFFDQQLHPQLLFASGATHLNADGTVEGVGDLTMRGKSVPVNIAGTWAGPAEGMGGEQRIALDIEIEIDRHAWGINWNAPLSGGREVLGPKVLVSTDFEMIQQ